MRHARAYGIAGLAALAVGAVAFAQSTVMPLPESEPVAAAPLEESAVADLAQTTWGDPDRGATLAGACAACHSLDGKSTDRSLYPGLGGQSERYIAHQLALFKSGERPNGIMQPEAARLSAQDMRDLGAHFATQAPEAGIADDTVVASGPYEGLKFYEIGQQLFRSGDASREIPACMACHGPAGAGNPGPAYPLVAGQPAWYSARRLQEYRDGDSLHTDARLFNVMAAVATRLTDEEVQAVASYMEGLHPRPDAATRAAMAAADAAPAAAIEPAGTVPEGVDGAQIDPEAVGETAEAATIEARASEQAQQDDAQQP